MVVTPGDVPRLPERYRWQYESSKLVLKRQRTIGDWIIGGSVVLIPTTSVAIALTIEMGTTGLLIASSMMLLVLLPGVLFVSVLGVRHRLVLDDTVEHRWDRVFMRTDRAEVCGLWIRHNPETAYYGGVDAEYWELCADHLDGASRCLGWRDSPKRLRLLGRIVHDLTGVPFDPDPRTRPGRPGHVPYAGDGEGPAGDGCGW